MSSPPKERLEIVLKQPNPLFEKWLERWLAEAERRNAKSQYRLRQALQALRSYPLPLASGRECAILRGFGPTLCNLIDEELKLLQEKQPELSVSTFEKDVQQVLEIIRKEEENERKAAAEKKRKEADAEKTKKPPKITKKAQLALAEEEERQRHFIMSPGSFRIWLLVDIQETSGKNKRTLDQTRGYLETLNIPYEVRRLTIGDFLWVARNTEGDELVLPFIVERKRMDDLASSIRDGRFHEQKHRLRQCGIQNVIYLVEDYGSNEHLGLPLDSLQQAMANTQIQSGFKVVHTENNWRSMLYLQGVTQTIIRIFKNKMLISTPKDILQPSQSDLDITVGLMKFRELYESSARNAQLTVRQVFVQQLLQLHSLSLEKALAIVDVYATPRLLLDAYDECATEKEARLLLANIKVGKLERQLGDKISQTVYEFYKTEF